mmetsp:Transcript_7125/g.9500  ORF Transcript_7125/g.9500 Transcript_7125/m.9500 type:complete len:117 (-) Transcript_7125:645-995(-)
MERILGIICQIGRDHGIASIWFQLQAVLLLGLMLGPLRRKEEREALFGTVFMFTRMNPLIASSFSCSSVMFYKHFSERLTLHLAIVKNLLNRCMITFEFSFCSIRPGTGLHYLYAA